jgi:hypothetical protein
VSDRSSTSRRRAVRTWLAAVLVVASALLVIPTTAATWIHRTVFDTDRFMVVVEPALDDPALYSALGEVVSDHALVALDLDARLGDRLADVDRWSVIAPLLVPAVEDRVARMIEDVVSAPGLRERVPALVRSAHTGAVALVRADIADLPNVYAVDGEIRVNLTPIIAEALRNVLAELREVAPDVEIPQLVSDRVADGRQQLAEALQTQLPPDWGQVTLMSEETLTDVQGVARQLDRYVVAVSLLTVTVIAAAIAVSPARRKTIVQLAIGVVLGLLLAVAVIRRMRTAVLDEIQSPDWSQAVDSLLSETLGDLRTTSLVIGGVAAVAAATAVLWGSRDRLIRLPR